MARNYRRRYSYARRAYRFGGRPYGGRIGLNISPAFIAGAMLGLTDLDQKIPAQAVLIGATAPVRGLGVVKGGCQGIIFGNTLQQIRNSGISKTGFQGI
jgi:hypothetical protein